MNLIPGKIYRSTRSLKDYSYSNDCIYKDILYTNLPFLFIEETKEHRLRVICFKKEWAILLTYEDVLYLEQLT